MVTEVGLKEEKKRASKRISNPSRTKPSNFEVKPFDNVAEARHIKDVIGNKSKT